MIRLSNASTGVQGFALVAVLVTVAVLSLIAASMLSTGRVAAALAHFSDERARANALLEAGVTRAILALLDQRADHRWRVDGVPYKVTFSRAIVTVRIQDELGKIDLNAADSQLLAALFASVGLGPQATDSIVDKILDWRGASELKRLNGATDADYAAAGASYHPRHGPFQRVDELLLVMGMAPDLYRRVEPALTVYSRKPSVDPQVAPPEALRALSQLDRSLNDRGERATDTDTGNAPSGVLAGRAFSIRADMTDTDGVSSTALTVIRLTTDPQHPYWVLLSELH